MRRTLLSWLIFLVAGTAMTLLYADDKANPSRDASSELHDGFSFISTKKNGQMEWKVEGSQARFISPTVVEIKNVRAIYFAEDGTNTVATTALAFLNKETRQVKSDEFVTIVTANAVTTGIGMEWDQVRKKAALKKDVKVVYSQPEGKGLLP